MAVGFVHFSEQAPQRALIGGGQRSPEPGIQEFLVDVPDLPTVRFGSLHFSAEFAAL